MTDRERLEQALGDAERERGLREWACDAHKDFVGIKARWFLSDRYPISAVITWLLCHYEWSPTAFDGEGCRMSTEEFCE